MTQQTKSLEKYLHKLKIEKLNPMQERMLKVYPDYTNIQLSAPTGSGKTLAFLLPVIFSLNPELLGVQVLILVPSRELAIQIEQVAREMGSGYKVNSVYGGQPVSKDKLNLKHPPAILIGTPGRVMDHLRRETFSLENINILVLDEFDKSLEVGFEEQMKEVIDQLNAVKKRILTSATSKLIIPDFVSFKNPEILKFENDLNDRQIFKVVTSPDKDKLETLFKLLCHIGNQSGIIFCNYKESIHRVSDYLNEQSIEHGCFFGGLDQIDRERALVKFRNGTHRLLLATDLAARGLDIPEIAFIIHYHLPHRSEEFIHRNGRTARVEETGVIYIIKWNDEKLPDFISNYSDEKLTDRPKPGKTGWATLYLSGGRKDKISKGDIAGFFLKKGGLNPSDLGVIELKQDCAFAGVKASQIKKVVAKLDNQRIKSRKVRLKII